MAKNRMIDTIFWEDNYSANLDPIEKLLFLYFLTNSSTNICGIYQITLKKIAVETGVDKEMVEKILGRFEKDDKVFYREGWIGLKNFIKHQNQNSPKVKKGIEIELGNTPETIKSLVERKGIDTLSHSNSNSNSNLTKLNTGATRKKKVAFTVLGAEVLKAFGESVDPKNKTYYDNTTQRASCDFLISEYGLEKVLAAVKMLPQINQQKLYIRQITTPYELKENWVKIGNALKQNQPKKVKII
jgi:hypothetical protein